jgi:hypothetical protein
LPGRRDGATQIRIGNSRGNNREARSSRGRSE